MTKEEMSIYWLPLVAPMHRGHYEGPYCNRKEHGVPTSRSKHMALKVGVRGRERSRDVHKSSGTKGAPFFSAMPAQSISQSMGCI